MSDVQLYTQVTVKGTVYSKGHVLPLEIQSENKSIVFGQIEFIAVKTQVYLVVNIQPAQFSFDLGCYIFQKVNWRDVQCIPLSSCADVPAPVTGTCASETSSSVEPTVVPNPPVVPRSQYDSPPPAEAQVADTYAPVAPETSLVGSSKVVTPSDIRPFTRAPSIFNHSVIKTFPTANTCSLCITLLICSMSTSKGQLRGQLSIFRAPI